MLLRVTIPGDITGPQRPVAAAAPLGRFPLGRPPRSLPPVVHQVPAASQQYPSDARYALLHKLDADLSARYSQAAALANPLARDKEKAPSKIGIGL